MNFARKAMVHSVLSLGVLAVTATWAGVASTSEQALTSDAGLITISGIVTDSSGNPVGGNVVITVNGSMQQHTFSDYYTGLYSVSVKPGSYSLSASTQCLTFSPSIENLNNLTANATVNFVGSGNDAITNCEPSSSAGGTSGSLTLSGVVTSAGHPVPGALVTFSGSAQGFRYADETGAYSFLVNPGSYSIQVSEGCNSYSPSVVNLNNLKTSKTENFVGSGNCPPAPLSFCSQFDSAFNLASMGDVCVPNITTNNCPDRFDTWEFDIEDNTGFINGTDCRFGKFAPPVFTSLTAAQWGLEVNNFIVYLFGCPYVGAQIGPLSDGLVPSFLLAQGVHFTTADLLAMSDDLVAGIEQTLSSNGSPALSPAQLSALQAQLAYVAANVPGQIKSPNYTFSTCGDAGL